MRKFKRTMAVAVALFFSVTLLSTANVSAAKKKLTVNKVYTTTTKVKGKTKKKYRVTVKIGNKTYKKTASRKGNYSIKIPRQSAGKSFYVRSYKKKRKKWKLYTKKKVYVIAYGCQVKKFSRKAKSIQGYTRPGYKVKVTANGKTYTKKASKVKGYFNIKLSKVAGDKTVTFKIYNTKGKMFKKYNTKAYNAGERDGKFPSKTDPINEAQVAKDMETAKKTGKTIDKSNVKENVNDTYAYYIRPKDGYMHIGYLRYYMQTEADGAHAQFTAKNGVTLYGCIGRGGMENIKEPTTTSYDFKLTSGQTKRYQGTDVPAESGADYATRTGLTYKVKGYKNGKLVLIDYSSQYLIAGYNDAMFQ